MLIVRKIVVYGSPANVPPRAPRLLIGLGFSGNRSRRCHWWSLPQLMAV
jgi:hypothetical protein